MDQKLAELGATKDQVAWGHSEPTHAQIIRRELLPFFAGSGTYEWLQGIKRLKERDIKASEIESSLRETLGGVFLIAAPIAKIPLAQQCISN